MSTDWSDPNSDPVGDVLRWAEIYHWTGPLPVRPEEAEHQAITYLIDREQAESS